MKPIRRRNRRKHTAAELDVLRAKRRAAREAATDYNNDLQILDFEQWCALLGIGAWTGRGILNSGDGPPRIQLGKRRFGIRLADHRKWMERLARGGTSLRKRADQSNEAVV
jgi:predicted DNA-binding transcriptional regulator AlpA